MRRKRGLIGEVAEDYFEVMSRNTQFRAIRLILRFGRGQRLIGQWKTNAEGRAFAWRRTYLDTAAMSASDTTHGGQPEAGAFPGGCEERIKNTGEIFLTNAAPIICDFNDGFFLGFCLTIAF